MQTINPQVFQAYQSCVSLYSTGIQFFSQYGYGSNSAFINVQFVTTTFGARAMITGYSVFPDHTATCQLFGEAGRSKKFYVSMIPEETYSVICKSFNNVTVDVVTVGISTTQGVFLTYLYNRQPATLLSQLQAQVTQLQAQMNAPMKQTVYSSGLGTFVPSSNPAPVYLKVRMVGGGGGGCGSGTSEGQQNCGSGGGTSIFGDNLVLAKGGNSCCSLEGGGAQCTLGISCLTAIGQSGGGNSDIFGDDGKASGGRGGAPVLGSGGGGDGAPFNHICGHTQYAVTGSGGGAGGYVEAKISPVSPTYSYVVGTGGSGGGGSGTCQNKGSNGGDGLIIIEEYF
jgi:hypothetical protein